MLNDDRDGSVEKGAPFGCHEPVTRLPLHEERGAFKSTGAKAKILDEALKKV
jgi:hypothetical protein